MAIDPLAPLATFAAILGLGFLGHLLFERTRVTDVLLLMAFGLIVGPWLGIFPVDGFQDASLLVGTLALIIILFDGGLGLDLKDLLTGLARSTVLAFVGFGLTVAAVAAVGHYLMALPWMHAALLGCILGGTSGIIIIPIAASTSAKPETRVLLSVESALTDVLCVIGAVTLIGIITTSGGAVGSGEAQGALRDVAAQFSIAIVLGLFSGFVWLRLLKALEKGKYSYMVTLAAVLGLYVGAQFMGGNGAIAVLIFGVVLGNGNILARKFDFAGLSFSDNQKQFQGEIAFLIRCFFFVYLGVILDPAVLVNRAFLLAAGILVGGIVVARLVSVVLSTYGDASTREDRSLIAFLMPRGLAATVLAGMPAQAGIAGTEPFLAYAFIVVAVTNVIGTLAVLAYERGRRRRVHVRGGSRVETTAARP